MIKRPKRKKQFERSYYELQGKTFGHWTVLENVPVPEHLNSNPRSLYWLCQCVCGEKTVIRSSTLRAGKSQSCGCHGKKYQRTEGGKSE